MSKFIPPQTTTAIRIANTPLKGELLFDTNLNKLFIGDGVTIGGIEVGTGAAGGGGGGGSGDMLKSIYDTNNDGIVDLAKDISGIPTINQYYGTNASGNKGFYNLPTGSSSSLISLNHTGLSTGNLILNNSDFKYHITIDRNYTLTTGSPNGLNQGNQYDILIINSVGVPVTLNINTTYLSFPNYEVPSLTVYSYIRLQMYIAPSSGISTNPILATYFIAQ